MAKWAFFVNGYKQSKFKEMQEQLDKLKKRVDKLENARKDQLSMAVVSGDLD